MIKILLSLAAASLLGACAQMGAAAPIGKEHISAFDENDSLDKYEQAYAAAMEKCLDMRGDERKACLADARLQARKAIAKPVK